jgi:hypothetical protein
MGTDGYMGEAPGTFPAPGRGLGFDEGGNGLGALVQLAGQFGHALTQHLVLIAERLDPLFQAVDSLLGPVERRPGDAKFQFQVVGMGPVGLHLVHHLVLTLEQLLAIPGRGFLPPAIGRHAIIHPVRDEILVNNYLSFLQYYLRPRFIPPYRCNR